MEEALRSDAAATTIESGTESTVFEDWIWNSRNYHLFAILANVRNGYGFAGGETGLGFKPIALPRGLPPDASDYVKSRSDLWDCDGHSHSYHTLKDLLEYDWFQVTFLYGVVNEVQYLVYKEKGKPDSYASGVNGMLVHHITPQEMEDLVSGKRERTEGLHYYTRVQWMETYKESAGTFYDEAIPQLQELAGEDPTSVRIVFFFDN